MVRRSGQATRRARPEHDQVYRVKSARDLLFILDKKHQHARQYTNYNFQIKLSSFITGRDLRKCVKKFARERAHQFMWKEKVDKHEGTYEDNGHQMASPRLKRFSRFRAYPGKI